jgi:hypothetical protein
MTSAMARRVPTSFALLVLTLSGCAKEVTERTSDARPQLQTPWSQGDDAGVPRATDPCADRLHDLCNPLLMHHVFYRRMPSGLEDLRAIAGPDPAIVFECPVSNVPYVYDAEGLVSPVVKGRIVLYDATPVHGGKRWAVVLEDTKPGQPLIPEVVALPESAFPKFRPVPATQPTTPDQAE